MEAKENGVILNLKVTPSSDSFEISGLNKWRGVIKVKVTSPAEKGKANEELLKEFKNILGKDIEIISGTRSKTKKLLVKRVSKEAVSRKLGL
ncbi:hypothetical protein AKJ56_01415 [candidate division MSBL1 archaeon SCGC-AAA382N08]|uniref:UPF0235 protein AKJ56_01415 n=1 Tax=candidate division MSBL1 archaeon SCGC-AAA382N08 TaxID=1698285 RepID=A0A133VPS1_9EURY|nr:hypothetical protein AKJ56_01415 [candidate division MSBL1 archaeon SCGC-AAA382N08]